ncbi:hypothetical protein NDU88_004597 [Pleurodeles waltl]|uniref:Uncharacterized protein n=1 Tax=Pleurodeles waltl TaxID=8319 RepID=A0AAV7V3F6_PLEWA|nr:hypothetical protein NDU88_004597 [Pleurodeles waltl]
MMYKSACAEQLGPAWALVASLGGPRSLYGPVAPTCSWGGGADMDPVEISQCCGFTAEQQALERRIPSTPGPRGATLLLPNLSSRCVVLSSSIWYSTAEAYSRNV